MARPSHDTPQRRSPQRLMGRHSRQWLGAALAALTFRAFAVSPAHAQDGTTVTGTAGGRGGGPFTLACPSGMAMVGVNGRYGAWVDAIAPICAIWVPGSRTLGSIDEQPGTGGGGGGRGWMRCEGRQGVAVGLWVWQAANEDRSVGRVLLECGQYEDPRRRANNLPGGALAFGESIGGPRVELRCGPGEVAVGLYGRSGAFVDRVGLLCQRSRGLATR